MDHSEIRADGDIAERGNVNHADLLQLRRYVDMRMFSWREHAVGDRDERASEG